MGYLQDTLFDWGCAMIKLLSISQVRAVEAAADAGGLTYDDMMDRAGRVIAFRVKELLDRLPDADRAVTILVGGGNNGGDGLTAAKHLAQIGGILIRCYLLHRREGDVLVEQARDAGVSIAYAEDDQRFRVLTNMIASANIVIDALYGIGIKLPLRDDAAKMLRAAAAALDDTGEPFPLTDPTVPSRRPARPYLLAVDCPSGLDCDTGEIDRFALHADETVTFIGVKPGLITFPGAAAVGELRFSHLGIPANLPELRSEKRILVDDEEVQTRLPNRPADAHKGTFGSVLIIGGSGHYIGAPALAAKGAYAVGAGLVTVAAPSPVTTALAPSMLETTWLPLSAYHDRENVVIDAAAAEVVAENITQVDSLVIGCGIGTHPSTEVFFYTLLARLRDERQHYPTVILDADALNMLSSRSEWWKLLPPNTILTPHPGEMGRLCGVSTADVQKRRLELVGEKSAAWNCVVVLKGAHTLIAEPTGRIAALPHKVPALAKAGTGDTLAGMIAGIASAGAAPFDAAVCGAYLHASAGMKAMQHINPRSVLASDLARFV
jgi:NAD(P)H-hydrate epimerase